MVKIVNAHLRKGERGEYVALELQGDIVMLQSQNTGRFYATAKRCFIFSTFDLATAKSLIGQNIQGAIERVECPVYDYTVKETGEVLSLAHTYSYVPYAGAAPQSIPEPRQEAVASFA